MKRSMFAIFIFIMLLLSACETHDGIPIRYAGPLEQPGWHERKQEFDSIERWFRVYVPETLTENAPVVMVLHGGTGNMHTLFNPEYGGTLHWQTLANENGFLLLVPNGTNLDTGEKNGHNQHWNDLRPEDPETIAMVDDVSFLTQLVAWCAENYAIDSDRVYVTGASNGGMMTYRLLIEAPEVFAAGAAFIGGLPTDQSLYQPPAQPTPLMIMNGTEDTLVPYIGGQVAWDNGLVMSTENHVAWWVAANHADPEHAVTSEYPDLDLEDGCRAIRTDYPALENGAPVVFVKLAGGGHTPPSIEYPLPDKKLVDWLLGPMCHDLEGAEEAWNFMKEFKRK